jgi:hypothetical protein
MQVDTSNWSGEGTFTQVLLDRLCEMGHVISVRVEDAPATRSEADYNFTSNELFLGFATVDRVVPIRRFGFLPGSRVVADPVMTMVGLGAALTALPDVGAPDYGDGGMLQYLRTERIVPPYQTRGYKLLELVRLYEVGAPRRS